MNDSLYAAIGLAALLALPGFLIVATYAVLRIAGKLSVNALGWRAESIRMGGRTVVAAVASLSFFEPLLRREAWLQKRLSAPRPDAPVSEVEVELVPLG